MGTGFCVKTMENPESNIQPIRPTDPSNPREVWTPVGKAFYRLKESRWYVLTLAILAFFVGYFLFILIARVEGALIRPDSMVGLVEWDLLYMAIIEQTILGSAIFVLFALSRTYQLTLLIYAGFLTYHIQLISEQMPSGAPLLFLLTPVFIYAFTGFLITLGLLFNKKLGFLFLVLSIFLLAQHNTQILKGHNLNLKNIFFLAESQPPAQ